MPFERVIEAIRPERTLSHDPLASVGLSFLPTRGSRLELPGVTATFEEISNGEITIRAGERFPPCVKCHREVEWVFTRAIHSGEEHPAKPPDQH